MVRKSLKRLLVLICALAGMVPMALPASAASYNAYDGNLSTTYITIFRDIVGKVSLLDDYVFFRSGQYEYLLVSGDLEFSGGSFTGQTVTVYRIVTDSAYSSTYSYFQTEEIDFSLSPGSGLVYSNLGAYPDLIDRTSLYSFASLILLLACVCMYLVRSIFSFTLRRS